MEFFFLFLSIFSKKGFPILLHSEFYLRLSFPMKLKYCKRTQDEDSSQNGGIIYTIHTV